MDCLRIRTHSHAETPDVGRTDIVQEPHVDEIEGYVTREHIAETSNSPFGQIEIFVAAGKAEDFECVPGYYGRVVQGYQETVGHEIAFKKVTEPDGILISLGNERLRRGFAVHRVDEDVEYLVGCVDGDRGDAFAVNQR